jgi:hypothetical protein
MVAVSENLHKITSDERKTVNFRGGTELSMLLDGCEFAAGRIKQWSTLCGP